MIIVILLPIVAIIALDRWIFADTIKETDYLMERLGNY